MYSVMLSYSIKTCRNGKYIKCATEMTSSKIVRSHPITNQNLHRLYKIGKWKVRAQYSTRTSEFTNVSGMFNDAKSFETVIQKRFFKHKLNVHKQDTNTQL